MKSLAKAERLLGRRLSKPELVLFISHRHNTNYLMTNNGGNLSMQHRADGFPQVMAKLLYQPCLLLQNYAVRKAAL